MVREGTVKSLGIGHSDLCYKTLVKFWEGAKKCYIEIPQSSWPCSSHLNNKNFSNKLASVHFYFSSFRDDPTWVVTTSLRNTNITDSGATNTMLAFTCDMSTLPCERAKYVEIPGAEAFESIRTGQGLKWSIVPDD